MLFSSLGKGLAKNGTTGLADVMLSANAGNKLIFGSDNGVFASQIRVPGHRILQPHRPVDPALDRTGGRVLRHRQHGQLHAAARQRGIDHVPLLAVPCAGVTAVASAIKIPVNGSDLISQGVTHDEYGAQVTLNSGYVTLYQEEVGLVSFGSGTWYFIPGTRQHGWIDAGVVSIANGATSAVVTAGFSDVEISDLTLSAPNAALSVSASFLVGVFSSSSAPVSTGYSQGGVQCSTGTTLAAVTNLASAWKLCLPDDRRRPERRLGDDDHRPEFQRAGEGRDVRSGGRLHDRIPASACSRADGPVHGRRAAGQRHHPAERWVLVRAAIIRPRQGLPPVTATEDMNAALDAEWGVPVTIATGGGRHGPVRRHRDVRQPVANRPGPARGRRPCRRVGGREPGRASVVAGGPDGRRRRRNVPDRSGARLRRTVFCSTCKGPV